MLENVERRRLLSASVVNGVIVVVGTPQADDFRVVYNALLGKFEVTNHGASEGTFSPAGITGVNIFGDDGDDSLYTYNTPPVTIDGGAGNDTITGPGVSNANQSAVIFGGDGDDSIVTYKGADSIDSGAGNDTIESGAGRDTIVAGDGDDSIGGGTDNDNISGGAGNDFIDGSSNNDTINGDDGDDYIKWTLGSDQVYGGSGTDTYDLSMTMLLTNSKVTLDDIANDTYSLNPDMDNVHSDFEILIGSTGNDTLSGSNNPDWIAGGGGNDTILGLNGNDTLDGGAGNDTLRGGNGDDEITGGAGNDSMFGDSGDDVMYGADLLGFDYMDGGSGANTAADYDALLDTLVNF